PNFAPAYWFLGQAYEQQGKYDEAIIQLQQAVNYSRGRALMLSSLGYTYAVSGHRHEAEAVLTNLQDKSHQNIPALTLAFIFAGLRQNDAAFEWLDKAY